MSLLWFDGFNWWSDTANSDSIYPGSNGDPSPTTAGTGPHFAEGRVWTDSTGVTLQKIIAQRRTVIVGVNYKIDHFSYVQDRPIFSIGEGGSPSNRHIAVRVPANDRNEVSVYNGVFAHQTSFLDAHIKKNVWTYVELKMHVDNTTGWYELRIEGEPVLSGTGLDTQFSTNDFADWVQLGNVTDAVDSCQWDDWYIADTSGAAANDFLGPVRVDRLTPNADGLANEWIGSDGNSVDNYLLVDDEVESSSPTEYVESSGAGDEDYYNLDSIRSTAGSILGVSHHVWASKTGTAPITGVNIMRTNSLTVTGINYSPSVTWQFFSDIFDSNPVTSLPWTESEIDSLQIGNRIL